MKFDILTLAAVFSASGNKLINLDENTSGGDDFAGELLLFTGDAIQAIHEGEDLPALPEAILNGTSAKITGIARVSLDMVSTLLPFIQMSTGPKYRAALRYLSQAINQLLAGKTVPPVPASVVSALQAASK